MCFSQIFLWNSTKKKKKWENYVGTIYVIVLRRNQPGWTNRFCKTYEYSLLQRNVEMHSALCGRKGITYLKAYKSPNTEHKIDGIGCIVQWRDKIAYRVLFGSLLGKPWLDWDVDGGITSRKQSRLWNWQLSGSGPGSYRVTGNVESPVIWGCI